MEENQNSTSQMQTRGQEASQSKRKFFVSLGIAVVVIILALLLFKPDSYQRSESPESQGNLPTADDIIQQPASTEAGPPVATGNIGDVEAALIQDSLGEFVLVEEFDESDLLTSDEDVLNGYANIYNENEF